MAEVDVEQTLRSLGRHVAYPPTPDIAGRVSTRLRGRPTAPPRSLWPKVLALAAALVIVFGVGLATGPVGVVAHWLGLAGVAIFRVATDPTPAATPNATLGLGDRVQLAEGRARVTFHVPVPASLGEPEHVYALAYPVGGTITLVYAPRPDLPPTSDPAIGALLTVFPGYLEPGFFAKGLGPGTRMELVRVGGAEAIWLEGSPHRFYYRDAVGEIRDDTVRLAGNVLLWERDGLTLRLEANVSKDRAVAIADSVR